MPAGPLWFNGATIQNTPAMNGTALAASLYVIGGATVKTVKQAANASLKTSLRIGPQPTSKHSLRWLELRGEKPVPETTEEALSREGELEVPLRAMITRDGDWARVSEVQFAEDVEAAAADAEQAANLAEDRAFLDTFTDGAEADRGPKTAFDFSRFKGST